MMTARYCGGVERLRGQSAILQPAEGLLRALAQFSNVHLGPAYALGWREFGVHEFDLTLSDQVQLARERTKRMAAGTIGRPVHLAEPTDADYEMATRELADATYGKVGRSE